MALIDAIKKLDEKIAERDGTPLPEKDEPKADDVGNDDAAAGNPVTEQDQEDTESDAAPSQNATHKDEQPAKPTDADFARMRREKAAAEKRERELAAEVERLRNPKPAEQTKADAPSDPEPDKVTHYESWLEWKNRQLEAQVQTVGKTVEDVKAWKEKTEQEKAIERDTAAATRELEEYERKFAPTQPDYAEVRQFAFDTIARSLRVMNPRLEGQALASAIQQQLFKLAGTAVTEGYDPIEYLYHKTKNEWGYQPKPVEAPAADTPPAKASISKIASNKAKSASSLSAGGKGAPAPLSKEAISKMPFHEIAKLGPEQFQQWENASKGFEG